MKLTKIENGLLVTAENAEDAKTLKIYSEFPARGTDKLICRLLFERIERLERGVEQLERRLPL